MPVADLRLQTEVAKLQAHRRKYKQRFNDNVNAMSDKFADIEERTTEAHDLYHLLSDRLEENVDECHQAQEQLDALQGRLDAMAEVSPVVDTTPYAEEAKANVKALEELVAGACSASRPSLVTDFICRDDRASGQHAEGDGRRAEECPSSQRCVEEPH